MRSWRLLLAGGVVLLAAVAAVAVLASGGGEDESPVRTRSNAAAAPVRVTAREAVAAIDAGDVEPHLRALARAAGAGGTRAAGTPGDAATRAYVAGVLRNAGWRVTVQPVAFPFFDERRPPRVTPRGRRALAAGDEVRTLAYSAGGRATGHVRAIGLAPGRESGSGCRRADFGALRAGEIALVQRGICEMRVKARNAQAADAAAVVIANDGRAGRAGAIDGTLVAPGLRIPAVFVSTSAGRALRAAGRATVVVDAISERRRTANVLAEAGSGPWVVMAGAHLDSVRAGPGLNDNGSGVAALLAVARAIGRRVPDGARLRLGLWGAEELGLYGSRLYVARLREDERGAIAAYVNLDMVGTRGGHVDVYRGDARIAAALRDALRDRGRGDIGSARLDNASDHAPFARAGIPVGGVFTGLDRCYHRACDDAGNVDPRRAADAAAATGAALLELSGR